MKTLGTLTELQSEKCRLTRLYEFRLNYCDLISTEDQITLDNTKHQLSEIDSAICRFYEGRYGICESCGSTIEEEVQEANIAARLCAKCISMLVQREQYGIASYFAKRCQAGQVFVLV